MKWRWCATAAAVATSVSGSVMGQVPAAAVADASTMPVTTASGPPEEQTQQHPLLQVAWDLFSIPIGTASTADLLTADLHSIVSGSELAPEGTIPVMSLAVPSVCEQASSLNFKYLSRSLTTSSNPTAATYVGDNSVSASITADLTLSCLQATVINNTQAVRIQDLIVTNLQITDPNNPAMPAITVPDQALALPFRFAQDPLTGKVLGCFVDPLEAPQYAGLKKAMAEVFNTNMLFTNGTANSLESGVVGDRVTPYSAVMYNDTVVIQANFGHDNVSTWAPGTNWNDQYGTYVAETRASFNMTTGDLLESFDRTVVHFGSSNFGMDVQAGPENYHILATDVSFVGSAMYAPNLAPLLADLSAWVPLAIDTGLYATAQPAMKRRRSLSIESQVNELLSLAATQPKDSASISALIDLVRREPAEAVSALIAATSNILSSPKLSRRQGSSVGSKDSINGPAVAAAFAALASSDQEAGHLHLIAILERAHSNDATEAHRAAAASARASLHFVPSTSSTVLERLSSLLRSNDQARSRHLTTMGALISATSNDVDVSSHLDLITKDMDSTASDVAASNAFLAAGNMRHHAMPLIGVFKQAASDMTRSIKVRAAAVQAFRQLEASVARASLAELLSFSLQDDVLRRIAISTAAETSQQSRPIKLSEPEALDGEIAKILAATDHPEVIAAAEAYMSKRFGNSGNPFPKQTALFRRANLNQFNTTTQWDSTANPAFNVIEPLALRQADLALYTANQSAAFMVGDKFGWDNVNLEGAFGVFAGSKYQRCAIPSYKALARLNVVGNLWSTQLTLLDLEAFAIHDAEAQTNAAQFSTGLHVVVLGVTMFQDNMQAACLPFTWPLLDPIHVPITNLKVSMAPYGFPVTASLGATLTYASSADLTICTQKVDLTLKNTLTLDITGEVAVDLLGAASAGIQAVGNLDYLVGPDARVFDPNDGVCHICVGLNQGSDGGSLKFNLHWTALFGIVDQTMNLAKWTLPGVAYAPISALTKCFDNNPNSSSVAATSSVLTV